MAMDGSSSSDGGNRRNGKRAAGKGFLDRLMREPKRGVGIAKLEKMRVEEEMMKDKYLRNPFSRAQISGPAGIGLQGMVSSAPFFFLFAKFNCKRPCMIHFVWFPHGF